MTTFCIYMYECLTYYVQCTIYNVFVPTPSHMTVYICDDLTLDLYTLFVRLPFFTPIIHLSKLYIYDIYYIERLLVMFAFVYLPIHQLILTRGWEINCIRIAKLLKYWMPLDGNLKMERFKPLFCTLWGLSFWPSNINHIPKKRWLLSTDCDYD